MKCLSSILAIMVLVLSATSCFMEDKCLELTHQTTSSQEQNDNDCGMKCCSPFFSCNTCTGFAINTFHFSIINTAKQPEKKLGVTTVSPVSDFPYSIWRPPQLA
jgi:hypothetical protein